MDRFSVEAFLNDGEQVVTGTVLTELSADRISFYVDGEAEIDVTKYDLFQKEGKK
jgi:beta-fructofuranosidase